MKAISECLYERGKSRVKYARRRIPAAVRAAYPLNQTHVVVSLGSADLNEAKLRLRAELTRLDVEFKLKRQELDLGRASMAAKRFSKIDDEQLQGVARFWVRQMLVCDEHRRQQGMDDEEFGELGEQLTTQRAELGRMLAQGKTLGIFPAMHSFLHLCGLDFNPDQDEAKRACYIFLRAVVETIDHQLARQRGEIVDSHSVVANCDHPLRAIAPERAPEDLRAPTWDRVF